MEMEAPPASMIRPNARPLPALHTLFGASRGELVPLPRRLARLYGELRMPLRSHARPHVFSNFVTTLDGVVSLNTKGHASGGDISGFDAQDRMVMGLLRAVADVIVVGSGTLAADRHHVWTAEAIFPISPMTTGDCGCVWEGAGPRSTSSSAAAAKSTSGCRSSARAMWRRWS